MPAIVVGDLVADRFQLLREVAAGGMGKVYRALDRHTDTSVAIKTMLSPDVGEVERFLREGAALAELAHPAIVRYVSHGLASTGEPFLAMEWLEGEDLDFRLARGPLGAAETLELARRVASALAAIHARGLIHRDIKPSNLFLVGGRIADVRIVDFGVARRLRDGRRLTRTGLVIGTPWYMAPEQARGERDVDARVDVFALGAVMFECLAGVPPFSGDNLLEVLAKIILEPAPRLSSVCPGVPAALNEVIGRMLAKDPSTRWRDGAALVRALDRLDGTNLSPPSERAISAAAPAVTQAERRLVCVLLARRDATTGGDPLGDTQLPQDRAGVVERLRAEAEPAGGRVELLVDGSVLVVVGGDGVASDHAARAAGLALRLQEMLPSVPLALATGRAEHADAAPIGNVVHRAVALLRAAAESRVWLDETTAELLGTRFDVETRPSGARVLGGVRDDDSSGPRRLLGRSTSFVGRDREIGSLEALFRQVVDEGEARAALVIGPAGAGKSRLRRELIARLERTPEGATILSAHAEAHGARSPFSCVAQTVRRAAGIAPGEPAATRRDKLAARIARDVAPDDAPHLIEMLGELVGAPVEGTPSEALRAARADPMLLGDAMRAAWIQWLRALSASRPLVIVVEDLHWGDLPSVTSIDLALRTLERAPLLVLALARPDVHDAFPDLWSARSPHEVRLAALGRKSAERLVREVLGATVDAATVGWIVDRAEGNPFYLEELIRVVADRRSTDRSPFASAGLPDTVLGMLQARLDALGPGPKRALRAASVFGERFWRGGVSVLLGLADRPEQVGPWLDELCASETVEPASLTRFPGEAELVFRHALVRDAAYEMLTERDRREGHERAGEWLESAGETDPVALAEHFSRGPDPARSIPYWVSGAEDALEGRDLDVAFERAERAVAAGAAGPTLGALRLVQTRARAWQGALGQALERALESVALLERGTTRWFVAMGEAVAASARLGQAERLPVLVQDMSSATAAADARASQIVSLCRTMVPLTNAAFYDESRAALARLDELAVIASELDPYTQAQLHEARGLASVMIGGSVDGGVDMDYAPMLTGLEAALASYEAAGALRDLCLSTSSYAWALLQIGDFAAAEAALQRALELADRAGAPHARTWALSLLALVLFRKGERDEALEMKRGVVDGLAAQGNRRQEGWGRADLAWMELERGNGAAAEPEARRACDLLEIAPPIQAWALAMHARALLATGRAEEAVARVADTEAGIERWGSPANDALVRLAVAEVLHDKGDRAAAQSAIRLARLRYESQLAHLSRQSWRDAFSAMPENVRTLALAAQWCAAD